MNRRLRLSARSEESGEWRFTAGAKRGGGSGFLDRAVVVAVVAVRVVKMAGYPIVHMIAVRDRFVATSGPVDVARFVPTAAVVGGAAVGVLA